MAESGKRRRHASKWSLVIGLVILVAVAMSCRNESDSSNDDKADAVLVPGANTK